MKQHKITVEKSARYFTIGEANERTKTVLFVCHGYAQLANEFLGSFSDLEREELLIVAPEGLHRFYTKGHERVAASWMTKEDRSEDIKDYIAFLDRVHDEVICTCENIERIIVLGFSQGAATVSRWASDGKSGIDELILFCGFFPPDLSSHGISDRIKLTVVTASNDRFVNEEERDKQLAEMRTRCPHLKHFLFDGEHVVNVGVVEQLIR